MPKPKRFAIVETQKRVAGPIQANGKRKIEIIENEFVYILYRLSKYGVLDNKAMFKGYYTTLEEAQAQAPDGVPIIRFKKKN